MFVWLGIFQCFGLTNIQEKNKKCFRQNPAVSCSIRQIFGVVPKTHQAGFCRRFDFFDHQYNGFLWQGTHQSGFPPIDFVNKNTAHKKRLDVLWISPSTPWCGFLYSFACSVWCQQTQLVYPLLLSPDDNNTAFHRSNFLFLTRTRVIMPGNQIKQTRHCILCCLD